MCTSRFKWVVVFIIFVFLFFAACTTNDQVKQTSQPVAIPQPGAATIQISPSNSNAAEPAIASAEDGTIIYVTWVEHRENKDADVLLQTIDADGKKGDVVRVNPISGEATAWRGDPPTIVAGLNGAVYVGWTAKSKGDKPANTLYLSVSHESGRTFESPVKVNDDTEPASHGMHSMAVDRAGRVYFTWLDERYLNNKTQEAAKAPRDDFQFERAMFFDHHTAASEHPEPNAEVYLATSDDGKTFSANRRLASDACPCCKTAIIASSDGHVYASWRQVLEGDFRHMAVAASADRGETFGAPVIVSDDKWQLNACPVSGPALSLDADGGLVVSWYSGGNAGPKGIFLSNSRDHGKTFAPRALVNEDAASTTPSLVGDRLVWCDADRIVTARQRADKMSVDTPRTVSTGSVPAAAIVGDKLAVVFTRTDGHRSGVWLSLS